MLNAPKQKENKWEQENATNQLQKMGERNASEKTRLKGAAKSNALVSHIYFLLLIKFQIKPDLSVYLALFTFFASSYILQRNMQEKEQEMQHMQKE